MRERERERERERDLCTLCCYLVLGLIDMCCYMVLEFANICYFFILGRTDLRLGCARFNSGCAKIFL